MRSRTLSRIAASLAVVTLSFPAACSKQAPLPDACTLAGGHCLSSTDTVQCGAPLTASCGEGGAYVCCSPIPEAGAPYVSDSGDDATDGDGDATASCGALAICCQAVPPADQSTCSSVAEAGTTEACASALGGYEFSGYCGGNAVPADAGAPVDARPDAPRDDALPDAPHDATLVDAPFDARGSDAGRRDAEPLDAQKDAAPADASVDGEGHD